jgi:hypothetical protein
METIKQTLFTGWHFMRWIRLVFAIFFVVQAIQMHNILIGVAGGFFLFTALTNTGCCGAANCAAPVKKDISVGQEETTFEEIKNK